MSLSLAYQAIKGRAPIGEDAFIRAFADWDITPIKGGAVMVKGPEVHVASLERGKWISRRLIHAILGDLLKRYGKAVTMVSEENEAGIQFVERLGFKRIGNGNPIKYELKELRHG